VILYTSFAVIKRFCWFFCRTGSSVKLDWLFVLSNWKR